MGAGEHFILKVDVLEAGKMGECKDLIEFDKDQIMMVRLGQSAVVSIKSGPRKKQRWISNRVIGSQGSLMHVVSEGWPVCSNPTDELL